MNGPASDNEELETRILEASQRSSKLEEIDLEHQKVLQNQQLLYAKDLFSNKAHTPVHVSSVVVNNAECVRPSVLQNYLDQTITRATTFEHLCELSDILNMKLISNGLVENCTQTLDSRGVLHYELQDSDPKPSYATPHSTGHTVSVVDIVPIVNLQPLKKISAKTGTNIGNGEGDGYLQLQWRNALGGGEKFTFDATKGTKTHSSYLFDYSQPLSPWWLWDCSVYKNSRSLGNMELLMRGTRASVRSAFEKHKHLNYELGVESLWRSTQATSTHSSDSLLLLAGDEVKNSLSHSVFWDTRDRPIFPLAGSFYKLTNELSPSKYWKCFFEASKVKSWRKNDFFTASFTLKGGYINNFSASKPLHISDKFHNGGSNDVRSFQLMGLGPKDLHDSLGGDAFVSYGVSLFSRLPFKRWSDSNFRLHAFFNGARLINTNGDQLKNCISSLAREHSTSTGIGLVLGHPVARFELNFGIPLTAHTSDSARKGFQYGIGLSFL
ncbi:SAM complex subunit SAM50 [Lachancea thermotolerans CBS 6340]|uniref:KLTH0G10824p n=1 Tax=Lachancea thermotolerans (strain ATCC 56472 / CBS 6340 / NRRL Y-8284) TaxID=559295 RepID=C5DMQ6_LACTC|nr:KLTH0G10824p [Lachancea thermotolerans CBS 6340]CAR25067.1 KLTH0G10824p [Lachancea thermotolerans CBS 6340]